MKIMIVDDHSGMREMLRSLFREPGCDVRECVDGSEALALYRSFQPDWVLMDIVMKNLDGLSAARAITAAFPQARVLIVANDQDARTRQAAQEAGACGFVPKDRLLDVRKIMGALQPTEDSALSP
jgi:DNA-binding NarL/FixJ family response regulator